MKLLMGYIGVFVGLSLGNIGFAFYYADGITINTIEAEVCYLVAVVSCFVFHYFKRPKGETNILKGQVDVVLASYDTPFKFVQNTHWSIQDSKGRIYAYLDCISEEEAQVLVEALNNFWQGNQ